MSEPRIVTPKEAREWDEARGNVTQWDLAHTVMVLSEQVAAVLALHQWDDEAQGVDRCKGCGYYWPCATARALGEE